MMKSFIAGFLFLFSLNAFACPDISGIYESREGTVIKYVQQDCARLTRYLGERDSNGNISFPDAGMPFPMNGKPQCGIRDFCTTVTPHADHLEFKLNFTGGVDTDTHGSCEQRAYDLSLDENGDLAADYAVFNCVDKFTGAARKTFVRR